MDWNTLYS